MDIVQFYIIILFKVSLGSTIAENGKFYISEDIKCTILNSLKKVVLVALQILVKYQKHIIFLKILNSFNSKENELCSLLLILIAL